MIEKKLLKLFPALSSDEPVTLADIVIESEKKVDEHDLYARIVERKHQLIINEKLIDLKAIPLSDEKVKAVNTFYEEMRKNMQQQRGGGQGQGGGRQ